MSTFLIIVGAVIIYASAIIQNSWAFVLFFTGLIIWLLGIYLGHHQ
jgi:uncharacterized membrane protein